MYKESVFFKTLSKLLIVKQALLLLLFLLLLSLPPSLVLSPPPFLPSSLPHGQISVLSCIRNIEIKK